MGKEFRKPATDVTQNPKKFKICRKDLTLRYYLQSIDAKTKIVMICLSTEGNIILNLPIVLFYMHYVLYLL